MTDKSQTPLIRTGRFDFDTHLPICRRNARLALWRKTRPSFWRSLLDAWRKPNYAAVAQLTAGISKSELLPSILPYMPFNPDLVDPKETAAAGFRFPETVFGVLFGDRTGTDENQ